MDDIFAMASEIMFIAGYMVVDWTISMWSDFIGFHVDLISDAWEWVVNFF